MKTIKFYPSRSSADISCIVTFTVLDMRGSTPLSRSMKTIKVTMQEIYDAMKPSVHKNKKKYTRKTKHKKKDGKEMGDI